MVPTAQFAVGWISIKPYLILLLAMDVLPCFSEP